MYKEKNKNIINLRTIIIIRSKNINPVQDAEILFFKTVNLSFIHRINRSVLKQ